MESIEKANPQDKLIDKYTSVLAHRQKKELYDNFLEENSSSSSLEGR